jgi:hypothetical protein
MTVMGCSWLIETQFHQELGTKLNLCWYPWQRRWLQEKFSKPRSSMKVNIRSKWTVAARCRLST